MTVDPAEVLTMGQALGVRADAVDAVRGRLSIQLNQVTWSGTGASRFRFDAAHLDRRLAQDADDLRRLMALFKRLADALEDELLALRRIEDRVRTWLAINRYIPPPWPPNSLPAPGDPSWRDVERAFAAAGVALDGPTAGAAPSAAAGVGDAWKGTLSPAEAWIIEKESKFDPTAVNADSGAFGLWQGLGATLDTYAARFGFDPRTTDPNKQLTMFRAYIKDRYGNAEKAVAFWQEEGWY